jgi:hypothetical protein
MKAARITGILRRRQACPHAVVYAILGALTSAAPVAVATPSEAQSSSQTPNTQTTAQQDGLILKADAASLCALVGKMQVIAFRYGRDPATAELRELQPYAVGYTKQHNVLLFGRQMKGYSKSSAGSAADSATGSPASGEGLPGWRNFRIDKIDKGVVNARTSTFEPMRPEPGEHRYITEFVCKNEFVQQ